MALFKMFTVALLLFTLAGCQTWVDDVGKAEMRAMQSSESLIGWASNGGQGLEEKFARCVANGHNNYVHTTCHASNLGISRQVNGREAPSMSPGIVMQRQPPQQYQQQLIRPQTDYPVVREATPGRGGYHGRR